MKKLSDITSKFKNTKFRVQMTAQAAIDVQKAMFVMGFRDYDSESGTLRVARTNSTSYGGGLIHAFYIDKDNRFENSGVPGTFSSVPAYREITILEVFEAAKEFKALKKELRKQRQAGKRTLREAAEFEAKLVADGWIKNTGTLVPGAVRVLFKDGSERADAGDWSIPYAGNDGRTVVAYKLEVPAVKPTVSLTDMVANIVSDAGGVEVDSDGYTVWNGGECPVADGTLVDVKYRKGDGCFAVPALTEMYGGFKRAAASRFWAHDNHQSDIVAYRLSKPELALVPMEPGVVHYVEPKCAPMDITNGAGDPNHRSTDTNPKRQFGVSSVPLNMWSPLASAYGSLALYNGSLKYGKANFANTPVEASIYIAAAFRHLSAWASGQEFDPADGVPNLAGVLANVAILLEARAAGMLIDDRLKMAGYLKEIDALKEIVKSLNELHAGKNPHHYTIGG